MEAHPGSISCCCHHFQKPGATDEQYAARHGGATLEEKILVLRPENVLRLRGPRRGRRHMPGAVPAVGDYFELHYGRSATATAC